MDFASVVLFLMVYTLRPQEWSGFFSELHPITWVMVFGLWAMVTRRRKFVLQDLLRTPHDWMMLVLFAWIIFTSPTPWDTFGNVRSYLIFYLVVVQALSSIGRIHNFLTYWTALVFIVAALALAGEHGFDPFGSYDVTHGIMLDRLVLGLSIYDNPNALGHAVVPSLAMIYFTCAWSRPIFMKQAALVLVLVPAYCIFLTQSKGAFLSSFANLVLSMAFGRPKVVQIIVFSLALTTGWAAVRSLPRMDELRETRSDKAIAGRVIAFQHGFKVVSKEKYGVGHGNWFPSFYQANGWHKAAHSGFVQVGTELGFTGFTLYIGLIYCSLRVLLTCRTSSIDEERIRRLLFCLVVSYTISSWLVDLAYFPTYFIIAACVAAFHRQLLLKNKEEDVLSLEPVMATQLMPAHVGGGMPSMAPMPMMISSISRRPSPSNEPMGSSASLAAEPEPEVKPAIRWKKIGLLDVALIWAMGELFLWYWEYVCNHF